MSALADFVRERLPVDWRDAMIVGPEVQAQNREYEMRLIKGHGPSAQVKRIVFPRPTFEAARSLGQVSRMIADAIFSAFQEPAPAAPRPQRTPFRPGRKRARVALRCLP